MTLRALWPGVVAALLIASPAWSDEKGECMSGIAAIKRELARKPPMPVRKRLEQALSAADQEAFEGDWEECVAAVRKGRRTFRQESGQCRHGDHPPALFSSSRCHALM